MLQIDLLPTHRQTYLQGLAAEYTALLPDALAVHSLVLLFDILEALDCTPEQIERVFGPEIMLYLTGLLYGAQQAAEGIPTPLAVQPLLTVNGRPVPLWGHIDGAGRIHYTPAAAHAEGNGSRGKRNGACHAASGLTYLSEN